MHIQHIYISYFDGPFGVCVFFGGSHRAEVMCLHPQEKVQVCVVYAVVQPGSLEKVSKHQGSLYTLDDPHTHRQAERIVGFLIFFSNFVIVL